jgi:hypothetical protein
MIETLKTPTRIVRDRLGAIRERRRLGPLYSGSRNPNPLRHLAEAVQWLVRAQDFGEDRGFSYGSRFGEGFLPSYPETTGYIIPTFFRLSEALGDASYAERAVQAAHWEVDVQMPCGAVMAGCVTKTPRPAVFNTGQVLLGWIAAWEKTGERRFRDAADRAASWLVELQQADGSWLHGNSPMANAGATVYNVKAAWGLCRAGVSLGNKSYVEAAVRNAEYAMSQQADNGWFSNCCLTDPEMPLLHTLAYTLQGLLGISLLTGRDDLLESVKKGADVLLTLMAPNGFIPGRITSRMEGAVDWSCLTGTAQISIVWSRLHAITGDGRYLAACRVANRYLLERHDVTSQDDAIRGGMAGSWPVWGGYGQYMVLNWATKFFVDALMLEPNTTAPLSSSDAVMG